MTRIVLSLLLLASGPALAVGTLDPAIASDGLLALVRNAANSWSGVLRGYATDIFWSLAAIQLVWTLSKLALKQSDFGELAAEFIRWIVITGFYAAMLLYSVDWAQAIIDSFRQAAAGAAGTTARLQPGDMFALGVEIARTVASVGLTDPVTSVLVALSSLLIVMCFVFLSAFLMVTLIESYFVINAGVFFMAFGGSEWTREYAHSMLRYSLSVGAKLFVIQLLVGLIMISVRTLQAQYTHDETSMFVMAGVAAISTIFCKILAEKVQDLITGVSSGGGAPLGAMAAAGLAGVAAGAAAMSSVMSGGLTGGAGKSVSDLLKSSFAGGPGSGGSSTPGSFMNSGGGGGSSGGGGSAMKSGLSPRTGGGGHNQAPSAPPTAQASSGSQSSSSPAGGQSASSGNASSSGSNAASKIHAGAHMATAAAVRGVGIMGSMAVPGMEEASNISVGSPPSPPDMATETPENIIRPESASPSVGDVAEGPAPAPSIDTLSGIQDALNNKGKA